MEPAGNGNTQRRQHSRAAPVQEAVARDHREIRAGADDCKPGDTENQGKRS
jgi:hypothetical protein